MSQSNTKTEGSKRFRPAREGPVREPPGLEEIAGTVCAVFGVRLTDLAAHSAPSLGGCEVRAARMACGLLAGSLPHLSVAAMSRHLGAGGHLNAQARTARRYLRAMPRHARSAAAANELRRRLPAVCRRLGLEARALAAKET